MGFNTNLGIKLAGIAAIIAIIYLGRNYIVKGITGAGATIGQSIGGGLASIPVGIGEGASSVFYKAADEGKKAGEDFQNYFRDLFGMPRLGEDKPNNGNMAYGDSGSSSGSGAGYGSGSGLDEKYNPDRSKPKSYVTQNVVTGLLSAFSPSNTLSSQSDSIVDKALTKYPAQSAEQANISVANYIAEITNPIKSSPTTIFGSISNDPLKRTYALSDAAVQYYQKLGVGVKALGYYG